MAERDIRSQGERRICLGDRAARAQRGFRRRRFRLGTAAAAPRCRRRNRRRYRRRQRRPDRRRDRGARLSRRILRPSRDHGSAPRRGDRAQFAQSLDLFRRAPQCGSSPAWDAPSPRWSCADASPMCCMSATRRAYRLRGERLALLTTDHVREERGAGRSNILIARARRRNRGAARLCRPAGGAARPLPAVQRRRARLSDAGSHRRHSARALRLRGFRARAGERGARWRQHRQLHRAGARRRRSADGGIGRYRRRIDAAAADPGADRRRDGRRLCAQGADVGRPLYPAVRRGRRSRRRRGGAEISQTSSRGGRHLSRRLRSRSLGRRARATVLGSAASSSCRRAGKPASTP